MQEALTIYDFEDEEILSLLLCDVCDTDTVSL